MTKFLLYSALFSLALFSSCSDSGIQDASDADYAPLIEESNTLDQGKVEFTINNQNGAVLENEALLLTNSSENVVSYHWDFGNGDTSTEANPIYTYERHGIFTIKLSITDKYGETQEMSHDISVICLFDGQDHGGF